GNLRPSMAPRGGATAGTLANKLRCGRDDVGGIARADATTEARSFSSPRFAVAPARPRVCGLVENRISNFILPVELDQPCREGNPSLGPIAQSKALHCAVKGKRPMLKAMNVHQPPRHCPRLG